MTAPRSGGADRARAVRGLALAARSLEQAAGDLTLAQYRVLAFVAAGTERSSLVAEGLALAKPTVTAAVDGLVERKLLTREAVEGDRRSFRLAVTRAGTAALAAAEHSMGERLDRVLDHARDRGRVGRGTVRPRRCPRRPHEGAPRTRGSVVTAAARAEGRDVGKEAEGTAAQAGGPDTGEKTAGDRGPQAGVASKQGWIRRLVGYMKPHKKNAYVAFGVAIGGQLIQSLLPLVQRVVVDDVITPQTQGKPGQPLAPWLILMIVMGVATFICAYFRRFRGGRIALDVQHDLRTAIFAQLQRLDFARHDELATGQLVSRASSDVALVQGFLQFLPIGVANILLFVVSFAAMLWLSPLLSLVMLAVTPALLFTALKLRTSVFPASWDAQQKAGEVANVVEEDVTGVRVVKGFGQEARELDRLTDRSRDMFASRVRLVNIQARLQPTMQTIPAFGQVAVLALGGWLALHGNISLGTFLAFCTYMLLITPPIRQFAAILAVGQLARAGAERIYDLLDSTPVVQDAPDAVDLVVPRGEVRFDHVTFGYTSTEPVLREFDLTVAAGETVALVGSSGSGKSTVALMLPRFYDVHAGTISIDGVDVRDVHLDSLRGSIGVVFEDSFLFSDTLTANIGFGRPDATFEEIQAAARAAEAHEFILQLPAGYDTVVGEQGLTLSGGQRQRVALARALLSDPKILLLDDATSSVDSRVEEEIHATLRRIASTRTTILIAHRRSSLSLADRIVVVDKGAVLDAGTHDELWARCSLYRMLLSGPGEDAEGLEAVEEIERAPDDARRDGITVAAWRGLADDELRDAQIADRTRTASPSAAVRVGGAAASAAGAAVPGAARSHPRPSSSRRSMRSSRPPPTPRSTPRSRAGSPPTSSSCAS